MKYFDFKTAAMLRVLDFDDMMILALLYDNYTGTQCGKILNISQPSVQVIAARRSCGQTNSRRPSTSLGL